MDYKQMSKFWKEKYETLKGSEHQVVGAAGKSIEQYTLNTNAITSDFKEILSKGNTVVDFGCGIGRFKPLLQKYFKNYIGVDLVKKIITNGNADFYETQDFLSSDIKADAIFCCVVLQHIAENTFLKIIIDKFRDILPIGGKVYLNEQAGKQVDFIIRQNQFYLKKRTLEEYDDLFNGFKRTYTKNRKDDSHNLFIYRKMS